MKITVNDLIKSGACIESVIKYQNTPELHVELPINELITSDNNLIDDIQWLVNRLKKQLVVMLKFQDNGYWKTRQYDENGNQIRYENSDGDWQTWQYDENGNQIRYENSDGDWQTWQYDERGNKIRSENSDGYWETRQYDERGHVVSVDCSIEIVPYKGDIIIL
jgi:YD repeat-containing protein